MIGLGADLLRWYTIHKRELPWRETKDPYAVWLSEVILQQTRIDQGLSYYLRFIEKYPTVHDLAGADEDEVLKLWQGLGYYSRARNLHAAARTISSVFNGKFPDNYRELIKLKGVGEYTAAAISSISFNQPCAVVDGNVFRVLSRLYGITTPVNTQSGKKEFTRLANTVMDKENPGEYNQAIMEFGALYCTPKNPGCDSCMFNDRCVAFKNGSAGNLPVKTRTQKLRSRYFNYLIIRDHDHVYIRKRTGNDIWRNLYEFPLIETEEKTKANRLENHLVSFLGYENIEISEVTSWQKQLLSHQCIHYRFIYIRVNDKKFRLPYLLKVDKEDILNFAVPKPIEKELDSIDWS
ncbi:MAG: A/G-specific adenine glycosylase [Prolixibacteraceae bacterium]